MAGLRSVVKRVLRALQLHPFLVAAFPTLFLLKENLWGLGIDAVAFPLFLSVGTVAVLQIGLGVLTRKPRKVAILLSLSSFLFFSYGHIWRIATDRDGLLFGVDGDIILGSLAVVLAVLVAAFTVRTHKTLIDVTRVANVIAVTMMATLLVPLGSDIAQSPAFAAAPRDQGAHVPVRPSTDTPDIYFLVFDRYAGARTLEEYFGYDNHEFLDALKDRGFQIADRARANYVNTTFSLGSSLNMQYLDWLTGKDGTGDSRLPVYDVIRKSSVARFLQSQRYKYVHVGNKWDMTRESPVADVNIRTDSTSELTRAFLSSTALLPAMRRGIAGPEETSSPSLSRRITLRQFDEIERFGHVRGPKFLFAHFGVPHPPYAFDRMGRPADPKAQETKRGRARAYLQQLQFTNDKILALVDSLLDVPIDRRPVIVLASDEGPYPGFSRGYNPWWLAPRPHLRTKFRILNAFHLPGAPKGEVYPELSPVNTFRLIFNRYFDAKLPLLPDQSFVSQSKERAYNWVNITDQVVEPRVKDDSPRYPASVDALPPVRRAT